MPRPELEKVPCNVIDNASGLWVGESPRDMFLHLLKHPEMSLKITTKNGFNSQTHVEKLITE